MHIHQNACAYTIRRRDGAAWHYASLEALVADLKRDVPTGNARTSLARAMRTWDYVDAFTGWTETDGEGRFKARHAYGLFLIEDHLGEVATSTVIEEIAADEWAERRRYPDRGRFVFPEGPVAGIRRRRGWRARWRRPSTRAEIRMATADDADIAEVGFDPDRVRRKRPLPTAWNDAGRHVQRSWKRNRATQWRG